MMKAKEKLLGESPIPQLLAKLSIPAITGMLTQALYNIVDSIFVGRVIGAEAIGGITIVFPIQMIVLAIGQTLGLGGSSMISRFLGAREMKKAEKTLGNLFSLTFIVSAIIITVCVVYMDVILNRFGATPENIGYAREYLTYIVLGTFFMTYSITANNIARSQGNAKTAMFSMMISGGLNIVLDYIFVMHLNAGVKGVAIATAISQACTAIFLTFYFISKRNAVRFHLRNIVLKLTLIREVFAIGAAAFARQVAGSILVIIVNNSLKHYAGNLAGMGIAVFGVTFRLLMFAFMPIIGILQGSLPIIGFNYGAKNYARVLETLRVAAIVSTILAAIGTVWLGLFPRQVLMLFNTEEAFIEMGVNAIRIVVLVFPLVGIQVIGGGFFQALGKAVPGFVLSLTRQVLFLIPLVLILPVVWEMTGMAPLDGVWYAFPISDLLSALVTIILLVREVRLLQQAGNAFDASLAEEE